VLEEQALELIEAAGLPRPTKQKKVRADKARRLDLCFVEQKVVVEVDGYAFHSGVDRFEDDRSRDNALLARGYLVLHWTATSMSERGDALVEELSAILKRR
jgi:very-short-patch-repair endonuclease